jgi:hypothetical protein
MRTILAILWFFLLIGCRGGTPQKKTETPSPLLPASIPVIDISSTYPDKKYGDICELEYIPLETNDNVLIDKRNTLNYVSNERIIITNDNIGDIFIFDGKGKILFRFNHRGGGPKEYPYIRRAVYDDKNREIFVFSYKFAIVYSEQGEYKRRWNYGKITGFNDIFDFDDESLLAHVENSEKTDSTYVFISKIDGEILSFINLPAEKIIASTVTKLKEMRFIPTQQLFNDGDDFILSPISLDTVYRLTKEKQLIPLFTRTPSVQNSDTPSVIMSIMVTDKFIMLFQYIHDINSNSIDAKILSYDVEEKRFYGEPEWDCHSNPGITVRRTDLPRNWYASLMDIHYINDAIEKRSDKVDDKLKALAKILDDDDNPVLEIVKFK